MKRYSIMVVQYGTKHETELCQVDNDPHSLAQAAAEKKLRVNLGTRMSYVPKYDSVRVVDHEAPAEFIPTQAGAGVNSERGQD